MSNTYITALIESLEKKIKVFKLLFTSVSPGANPEMDLRGFEGNTRPLLLWPLGATISTGVSIGQMDPQLEEV